MPLFGGLRTAVNRPALSHLVAGEGARLWRRQIAAFKLREKFLFAGHDPLAQPLKVEASSAGLGEETRPRLLLLFHVVLDVLGEHLDLRVVELIRADRC